MLPSDMNLRIGKVKNYNNKILISSPIFKIGTNLKINLDGEKDKPDVKFNEEQKQDIKPNTGSNKEHKQDTKPDIKLNKGRKQDVEPNIGFDRESKQDMNKITYEEEKVALILRITSIFTVWWMFKRLPSPCICHEICVDQNSNACYERPQILRQPTNHFLCSIQNP